MHVTTHNCHGVFAIDFGTSRTSTSEGYLVAPAKIARTGVQVYRARELNLPGVDGNKEIRMFRPPEEVFSPISMATFEDKPLADNHPADGITATNWKALAVGDLHDIEADGRYLRARVIVRDKAAIDKVNAGKSQLSCGYLFDADMTSGISPEGEAFDGIQRRIRGNHVALVDVGRAGREVRIADAALSTTPGGRELFLHRGRFGGNSDPEPQTALHGRQLFLHRKRWGS
jgi:uncharacterized protein